MLLGSRAPGYEPALLWWHLSRFSHHDHSTQCDMGREAFVLQRWNFLCSELGVEKPIAEEWGNRLQDGYR